VRVRSPPVVLCGASSELTPKIWKKLDVRQKPKSFSRFTVPTLIANVKVAIQSLP
jgi:hypothetical protein